ncbi:MULTISPECIES: CHAT domain-containing protein [unclassified Microcoleus]|uniref:CHAT domain-containing protein n=3 Tax=Microcoleus TaxID=44471 RepID=UPI0025FED609|nr:MULTISPECIES: CHAT domain-containing protein [unclassified Microcoleus]
MFKQREPEFKLTQKISPIDIAEFQQTLDPKTAIIEWYIGNSPEGGHGGTAPTGFAFIITHNNIELVTYTTTEIAELETWKDEYLDQYRDKKTNKIWQKTLPDKLQKLSEILRLNEIVAQIPENCQQLILVPHRYLHLFPLHALPFTFKGEPKETAPRKYLLDCFPSGVQYAPSLQLLEIVKNRSKTRKTPAPELQPLFAIQNPTEDLTNTDMEVETIKQRFNPHHILIKNQATKIAFTENAKNLSNATYIHFSCHGLFDFNNPLLSLLALAGSIETTSEINPPQIPEINPPQPPLAKGGLQEQINPPQPPLGKGGLQENKVKKQRYVTMRSGKMVIPEKCLTLGEIFSNLELPQCNLVTLSACETGLTNSTAMTDEYIGLPSGFLYAGSMNVVSTLWKIDDFATAIFTIKFYQELQLQKAVAVALNATQNWMRSVTREEFMVWIELLKLDEDSMEKVKNWLSFDRSNEPPFRKPKYWAAFFATGY